jgi:hypothetical protein
MIPRLTPLDRALMRISKQDKARQVLGLDNVFMCGNTDTSEFWIVKGLQNIKYGVFYNKLKNIYTCECKNIRFRNCYHVLAVRIYKGEQIETID